MPDTLDLEASLAGIAADAGSSPQGAAARRAIPFDFRWPDRIAKSQLRAIHQLHENFVRNLGSSLSAYLRSYLIVNLVSIEQLSYSEFLECLPSPTCIASLSLKPYDGSAVLEIDSASVAATNIKVQDMAAVMVTATLPSFAQPGMKIDVTAAAIGDASNLQGGILLMTSLRGANGQIYAVAQGPVVTGGFVAGRGGVSQTVNHPTVGRSPNGATVERAAPSVEPAGKLRLQLRTADYATATRIADAINNSFAGSAFAESAGAVAVATPAEFEKRVPAFIAAVEDLAVNADSPARIVINERTGTIVMGKDVRIAPVAILHGNLSVEIQTRLEVSQPSALANGTTEVVPQQTVAAKEEPTRNVVLKDGATIEELVRALTAIGSSARDIIAILQNLRAAGALNAELEVI
jgi:flagellar P-ring protein precursor FlgI